MSESEEKEGLIKGWLTQLAKGDFLNHLLLVVVLFMFIIVGMLAFLLIGHKNAVGWACHDASYQWSADTVMEQFKQFNLATAVKSADIAKIDRLRELYGEARNRGRFHMKLLVYFYTRHYMAIMMATMLGLIAAIAFLFVSRTGWTNANSYVLTILIVMATAATFFGLFPILFDQSKNMQSNRELFIEHKNLEHRIRSYVATGEDIDGQPKSVSAFIHIVDSVFVAHHDYPLEYNPEKIPEPTEVLQKIVR